MKKFLIIALFSGFGVVGCGGDGAIKKQAEQQAPAVKAPEATKPPSAAIDYDEPISTHGTTNSVAEILKVSQRPTVTKIKEGGVTIYQLSKKGEPMVQLDAHNDRIVIAWSNYTDDPKFKDLNFDNNKTARRMIAAATGAVDPFNSAIRCEPQPSNFVNGVRFSVFAMCKDGVLKTGSVTINVTPQ